MAKRIKAKSGTDDRAVTAAQERKLKRQLPADLLSQKSKYSRPPKAASTSELLLHSLRYVFNVIYCL